MPDAFTVLIMAAGKGTRMRSETPKVLHRVCGKPMVEWVIDTAREAGAGRVVCVVRPGDGVAQGLPDEVEVAEQREGEGTGAAVLAARDVVDEGPVVVLSGDQPLITAAELEALVREHVDQGAGATLLTTDGLDPTGYGRIVRDDEGNFQRIVETKYTEGVPPEELAIREVNLGTYVFEAPSLFAALDEVGTQSGERYLTGVFPLFQAEGRRVTTHLTHDATIALGVNDRADLMAADELAQRRIIEAHARAGVTFLGPTSSRVEARVTIGADSTIAPGVSLLGATSIAERCEIGPHSTLVDCRVEAEASIIHSYAVEAEIGEGAVVGPFAYLRPATHVRRGAKVGTFVEVKNSDIGEGAKVPHLSYIGDAEVGEGSNLGASTITANYDGREKHRTKIGKSVKTSVHTSLVAPVDVGDRAYTGAGSVINEDVPDGALAIARPRQTNVEGYADRVEKDSQ
jgi:bifunctional UDP-N-acetylglucosamine pyrophosphorylase / glucosamine-1-phosphate N-acetyltransferase